MEQKNIGTVTQIMGPVLDIKFADGHLPDLLNAITVQNGSDTITAEVAQHVGCLLYTSTAAGAPRRFSPTAEKWWVLCSSAVCPCWMRRAVSRLYTTKKKP